MSNEKQQDEEEILEVEPLTAEEEAELDAENLDPLEKAERERDEYLQNWQRARADFKNLKRRTLEDIDAAVHRERSALLQENLQVLDYLDMALASPCESQDAKNLLMGVQMTRDQLWKMLEEQGVATITAEGALDPTRHQAVSTVETEDVEPGQIIEEVRKGYLIGERVLRFAQVKVSVAAEEAQAEPGAEASDEG